MVAVTICSDFMSKEKCYINKVIYYMRDDFNAYITKNSLCLLDKEGMGVWGWRIVINIYFAPIILIFLFIYSKLISLYRPHFLKLSFLDHFLKDPEVFPIVLFFSVSLYWSLRKAFLSLLAIVWNSEFKWIYLPFSPLLLASLLPQLFVRLPQTTILLCCISYSWEWPWSLPPVQGH